LRPIVAATLACAAPALVTGGIFGSWAARALALVAVCLGAGWAWLTLRSPGRESAYQVLLVPGAFAVGALALAITGGDASRLPHLMGDAINSGRILRPPVPFDPGWKPILVVVFVLLGYGASWVATALDRPRLAIAVPLPILGLTAITQPDDGQFIAGLCAFVPLLAALAVLFGGDAMKASELTKEFELKRALRGVLAAGAAVVALVVLSNASVLVPQPVYDPADQAQKPRPIPLASIQDRVLFEVQTTSDITGPWKTGVLDTYDGKAWRLPPFDKKRLRPVPAGGVVDPVKDKAATDLVTFTIRDLGDAATLPGVTAPTHLEKPSDLDVKWDPRVNAFRRTEGRLPADVTYTMAQPPYPDADQLRTAKPLEGDWSELLDMPKPPARIARLLQEAPAEPAWDRLAYVRKALRDVVVASGGGVPGDIDPKRVVEILDSRKHEASPYEIVAAEAMLARWAGIPARIGFGFDGLNQENGVLTVRPANAAQWLEVYFQGFGWVPLIQAPDKAKQALDNDPNSKFDPDTLASDEVAAELVIPIKIENFKQLYQRIREELLALAPYAAALLAMYLATPAVMKGWRRRKRRRWAEALGPRAQIAVEYAELRDTAHDLNVGHPLDTPLEYLKRVVDDDEHAELAWLVSRTLYGDLSRSVTDEDAQAAEELSTSLRRRLSRGQPFQARVLAALSKASLRRPYTDEVPNVVLLDPVGRWTQWRADRRRARRATGGLRRRLPTFARRVAVAGRRGR
jgi:transglutaminase-like putative cysteine protease